MSIKSKISKVLNSRYTLAAGGGALTGVMLTTGAKFIHDGAKSLVEEGVQGGGVIDVVIGAGVAVLSLITYKSAMDELSKY